MKRAAIGNLLVQGTCLCLAGTMCAQITGHAPAPRFQSLDLHESLTDEQKGQCRRAADVVEKAYGDLPPDTTRMIAKMVEHTENIVRRCTQLAPFEKDADLHVLSLLAILHDIGYATEPKTHMRESARVSASILAEMELDQEMITRIVTMISHHDNAEPMLKTPEGRVLIVAHRIGKTTIAGQAAYDAQVNEIMLESKDRR